MSDKQYTDTGRTMYVVVWVIIFLGLFLFFRWQGSSNSVEPLVSQNEYVVSADKQGHYTISGRINDYPVKFLVDTGASLVAIPQNVADRLHIKGRYPVAMSTANGEITGSLTRIKQVQFGTFIITDAKAVIIPANEDEVVLLGMSVLSHFSIIQQGAHLILKRQVK